MRKVKFISSKKVISAITALSLMSFSASTICGSAESNSNSAEIPSFVKYLIDEEQMGDIVDTHNLLDSDDEVIAYCLDFENAYLIYDTNGDVVEYSEDSPSPLTAIADDVYFTGPFSYYTETDDVYTNVVSGEKIDYDLLSEESSIMAEILETDENSEMDFNTTEETDDFDTSYSVSNVKVTTTTEGEYTKVKEALTDKPRCFDYYQNGYCGAVAVTTLLFYYNDYINSNLLKSSYVDSPKSLYNYLKNYVTSNSSYDTLQRGLTKAFPNIANKTYDVVIVNGEMDTNAQLIKTWGSYKYLLTTNGIPAILLLQGHPTYSDHWVVTYGVIAYYQSNGKIKSRQYVVNNGMGKNNVKIGCKYADGFVYLS
jgi:hypothetical protein